LGAHKLITDITLKKFLLCNGVCKNQKREMSPQTSHNLPHPPHLTTQLPNLLIPLLHAPSMAGEHCWNEKPETSPRRTLTLPQRSCARTMPPLIPLPSYTPFLLQPLEGLLSFPFHVYLPTGRCLLPYSIHFFLFMYLLTQEYIYLHHSIS